MPVQIRDVHYPADFPAMAGVISAERVGWPVSAEDLAAGHAARDPRFFNLELLAEDGGQAVGYGSIGHIPYMHREGRFGLDLRVPRGWQGRGVGKALYNALMERIASLEPQEIIAEVWEALPRPRRFLEDRGFKSVWRRVDSTLDVRGFDFAPYQGLEERARADGLRIATYADLSGDLERDRKLHALDWALLQDMPYGESQTEVPLEQFIRETIHAPAFLTEACFVALCGDEWIGYTNLLRGEGFYTIQMTGVLRGWRGRGLATLLKLRGVAYALDHGGLELRTTNDSVNQPMFAINQRMGFRETGASLRYKKVSP